MRVLVAAIDVRKVIVIYDTVVCGMLYVGIIARVMCFQSPFVFKPLHQKNVNLFC